MDARARTSLTRRLGATGLALGAFSLLLLVPPAGAAAGYLEKFALDVTPAGLAADPEAEADGRARHRGELTDLSAPQDLDVVYSTEHEGVALTMTYTVAGVAEPFTAGTAVTGDLTPADPTVTEIGAEWWLDSDRAHCEAEASDAFLCGTLFGGSGGLTVRDVTSVTISRAGAGGEVLATYTRS